MSIPSVTLPHTVYWRSRKVASPKQMKNWLLAESGFCERAMEQTPRTCGSLENSCFRFGFLEPPMPARPGLKFGELVLPFSTSPPWAMKPSMTRWNTTPS